MLGAMRTLVVLTLLCAATVVSAASAPPGWFLPLRDAVYGQVLAAAEIQPLYEAALREAGALPAGPERLVLLSRCEYMMGRAWQAEERKNEAAAHYERGINFAQESLAIEPSARGWQMLAENTSQSCAVRGAAYAMAHGLDIEKYAKSALALDAHNTAALLMLAARWVYAPAPFDNAKRGIQMMEDILREHEPWLEKDDLFNVYIGIGYAYTRQKKYAEARPWLERALGVYPTNRFAQKLLEAAA